MSMKFSIIIPTYNNSEYLKVCLHSLLLQDFPKIEYEIIVVDDAKEYAVAYCPIHPIMICLLPIG